MTDTAQYCVMKTRPCTICEGWGDIPQREIAVTKTFCARCAGTGKSWEPVPLENALAQILEKYSKYWRDGVEGD